ncbi:hypothetical protein BHE74_00011550 [Ensete ventricosum]|nr:hypothetical protein GW17_00003700 [Ensete ventricosum]RWW80128.1 hypothetical protein BHE74_00011550 [Ensete ventricosum]
MQCHHLVSAVPKHSADLDVLRPRVEHLRESPMRSLPFRRIGLRDGPRITQLPRFLGRLIDMSMTEVRTKESSFAEEFNVDRHFRYAGSSWKSSITVFENSGWSDPSSEKKRESTFEGVGDGVEVANELPVQLLPGPYGEDEDVDEDGDDGAYGDRVEPIHGDPDRVTHAVSRHDDQAVGEEDHPEAVLVRHQRRPQLHERRDRTCVHARREGGKATACVRRAWDSNSPTRKMLRPMTSKACVGACVHGRGSTDGVLEHDGDGEDGPDDVGAEDLVGSSEEDEQRYEETGQTHLEREDDPVGVLPGELPHLHHPFPQGDDDGLIAISFPGFPRSFSWHRTRRQADVDANAAALLPVHLLTAKPIYCRLQPPEMNGVMELI